MAIGDKIDWRAGTIDPTTLQLIASAGAAQGAMYRSLGESVSEALEKDSEDYIVAAGKAFDKANKLLEREDDEDFNKEKHEKLIKKGVNLFRKAGEKYNIISGGFYGDSTLRTEEDIYKFYGFDPNKSPRSYPLPVGHKGPLEKGDTRKQEDQWVTPISSGDSDILDPDAPKDHAKGISAGLINLIPLANLAADAVVEQTKTASMLPDPTRVIDSVGRASEFNYPIPVRTGEVFKPGQLDTYTDILRNAGTIESSRELPNLNQIIEIAGNYATEEVVPNLKSIWDITKRGGEALISGGTNILDYIKEGAGTALDFIMNEAESIGAPERSLSPEALSLMNQPAWEADSARTTSGDYSQFEQPSSNISDSFLTPEENNIINNDLLNQEGLNPFTEEDLETMKRYHQSNYR